MKEEGYWEKFIGMLQRLSLEKINKNVRSLFEERKLLKEIVEYLQVGIIVISKKGETIYMNTSLSDIIGGEVKEGNIFPLWKELKNKKNGEGEIKINGPNPKCIRFWKTPISENFLLSFLDVTRERRIEEEKALQNKFSSFQYLASGMAHEIGNPLNALKIHAELTGKALNKNEINKAGKHLKVIKEEITRLENIVKDFLDVLRNIHLQLKEIRVEEIIKSTLQLLSPFINRKGIRCETSLSKVTPPLLLDRDKMEQSFVNIINNSLQATKRGKKIIITTGEEKGKVYIIVKDEGEGISAKNISHVFEPFFSTRSKGTGLGLTITQRIIKSHGGDIEVKSEEGKGTTVSIYLPIKRKRILLPAKKEG